MCDKSSMVWSRLAGSWWREVRTWMPKTTRVTLQHVRPSSWAGAHPCVSDCIKRAGRHHALVSWSLWWNLKSGPVKVWWRHSKENCCNVSYRFWVFKLSLCRIRALQYLASLSGDRSWDRPLTGNTVCTCVAPHKSTSSNHQDIALCHVECVMSKSWCASKDLHWFSKGLMRRMHEHLRHVVLNIICFIVMCDDTHTHTYTHTYILYIYIHTHINTHAHTHIYTHIRIHTHMSVMCRNSRE